MDRGAWRVTVHGVAKEDEMLDGIINSMDMSLSRLREIQRTEEPGVLQSTGSQRVGQD